MYINSIVNKEREKSMAFISQEEKKELSVGIKQVLKKFGMKGTIGVNHHSSLVVNVQSGVLDFTGHFTHGDGYIQVNQYHIDNHYSGVIKNFLNELLKAMKGTKWYNNSDAMVDYFDIAYYTDINIGKWNKPYVLEA